MTGCGHQHKATTGFRPELVMFILSSKPYAPCSHTRVIVNQREVDNAVTQRERNFVIVIVGLVNSLYVTVHAFMCSCDAVEVDA